MVQKAFGHTRKRRVEDIVARLESQPDDADLMTQLSRPCYLAATRNKARGLPH